VNKQAWGIASLTLIVGVMIGFAWGRLGAPGPVADAASSRAPAAIDMGAIGLGTNPGEQAEALKQDPDAMARLRAMADRAFDWGADPKRVVRGVIDQMDDDELISLMSSLTDYTSEELRDGRDLRAFAERLAEIAMDGTLTDPEPLGRDVGVVQFAARVDIDNGPIDPSNRFSNSDRRIYAIFESADFGGEQVFAKWTRISDGEVMLFGRYPINPNDTYSYVWLGAQNGSWEPGEYRVDFYDTDESLHMIASGMHVVSN
jgi:hypothetical protein